MPLLLTCKIVDKKNESRLLVFAVENMKEQNMDVTRFKHSVF